MKTDRLTLRQLATRDADWIARDIANPQVHRWITSPPYPYTLADAQAFVADRADHPFYRVIETEGVPCGVVSITEGDTADEDADIGYWLAQRAWDRGIMTEAAEAMLDKYFADHDVIESGWITGNAASENVLTKLGFRRTGETRMIWSHFHGQDMPVIRVRLDRATWAEVSRGRSHSHADTRGEESANA